MARVNRCIRLLATVFLLALGAMPQAVAQGAYKCRDAAGKITYADQECEKLGLRSAGEIKEKSSVAPAYKAPSAASRPAPVAGSKTAAPPGQGGQDGAAAVTDPKRRCFTVKTAKGTATRCNEEPGKD